MSEIHCKFNNRRLSGPDGKVDEVLPEGALKSVISFHRSLPGYRPTPLVSMEGLASRLGIGGLWVKSENERFDLKAFKVLGASYAIGKVMAERLGLESKDLTFDRIVSHAEKLSGLTFVTATDGNHGRAVAWTAEKLGCRAVVYMPKGSSSARLNAIRGHGAEASVIDGNYDDAVRLAARHADERGWVLLQDTSWPGYEDIPTCIMQGYTTLITESFDQLAGQRPTHIFVQAGVGSLAAAVLCAVLKKGERPWYGVVEPVEAACFHKSSVADDGTAHKVTGDMPTIMAGLACGEPSGIAWEILRDNADAFIACSDRVALKGMRLLGRPPEGDPPVISGESGAVTTGLVYELLSSANYAGPAREIGLNESSRVLVISTEGDTDPQFYRETLRRKSVGTT